jgi:hypothetical protein
MTKDNVLTLPLSGSKFVFTRYLYIKDEVNIALLISILDKSDDAIFWAYELLYSGFKHELFGLIWKIYYDFFATQNPSFSVYLIKKQVEYFAKDNENKDRIISAIIQNLLIRPFNTDIFFMRKICDLFEVDDDYQVESIDQIHQQLSKWIHDENYRSISNYILNNKNKLISDADLYKHVLNSFKLTNLTRPAKEFLNASIANPRFNSVKDNIILLAHIMSLASHSKQIIKNKNFYVLVQPEEVVQYETIDVSYGIQSYKILKQGCICGINDQEFLNLFTLERRNVINLQDKYNSEWLYHAAFSPTWFDRIKTHKGYIDYENKAVKFINNDWEEEFYSKYGYEPDEQPLHIKEKSISNIHCDNACDNDWIKFYKKYKNNGVILIEEDELSEMNMESIVY